MMKKLTIEEWAWLAGFIDGEGTITAYKNTCRAHGSQNIHWYPVIAVCNTNKEILEWIKYRFGGGVYVVQKPRDPLRHKQGWVWKSHGSRNVAALLIKLIPYLRLKRGQAELVLRFAGLANANVTRRPIPQEGIEERERILKELRRMNAKGPLPTNAAAAFNISVMQ